MKPPEGYEFTGLITAEQALVLLNTSSPGISPAAKMELIMSLLFQPIDEETP